MGNKPSRRQVANAARIARKQYGRIYFLRDLQGNTVPLMKSIQTFPSSTLLLFNTKEGSTRAEPL